MTAIDRGERLLLTVARLNRWASRHATLDVPPAQARLLALVHEVGPARIGDLATADHCSQPTMTMQVQRVESLGWVSRRPDPVDARAWLVEVTPEGAKVLRRIREARAGALYDMVASLTPHEQQVLDEAVDIMQAMIDEHPKADAASR